MKSLSIAALLLMGSALTPVSAADMTHERALNVAKEPQNWLMNHGNYEGHRFSQLKTINTSNVKDLKIAFSVALGGIEGAGTRYKHGNLEATPLVEDGIMYLPDGWGTVYAIDVSSGKKGTFKWRMDPKTDKAWAGDVACCGVNNRGVALWKDKVISITLDGRLIATNKATGEIAWERKVADPAIAETLTAAPLIVRDIAIVGSAGGEYGIRGFIDGTDLNTGQGLWRTHTIPGAGEPGNETWKDGKERWKHGGASIWVTATYDPNTDTFYQGTGNPGPDWDAEYRPGDNKWASSVLAISPSDGKIKWGFQYTPNDPYDFDEISEHPIINGKVNGEDRKLVVHAARNGFFYVLDRTNGKLIAANNYVKVTWASGVDLETGRPVWTEPTKLVINGPAKITTYPNISGGTNWFPMSYSPLTGLAYVNTINIGMTYEPEAIETIKDLKPGQPHYGVKRQNIFPDPDHRGFLKAIDPLTGKSKWETGFKSPNWAGTLVTAAGLVFTGTLTGEFIAVDADTGKILWQFQTPSGIIGQPVTWERDGKQYVTITSGIGGVYALKTPDPNLTRVPTGGTLWTFKLLED
jgi:alcohol dehydrogenase (cytochrome c)